MNAIVCLMPAMKTLWKCIPAYHFKIREGHRGLMIADERGKRTFLGRRRRVFPVHCCLISVYHIKDHSKKLSYSSFFSFLFLSFSLFLFLFLIVPRDHRRLSPLSVLRSLPAFKLFRQGRGERAKTTEKYSGTCCILAPFSDDVQWYASSLRGLVIPDSGIKRKDIKRESRIRTLFKSHVDSYLRM